MKADTEAKDKELETIKHDRHIEYVGFVKEVNKFIQNVDLIVLPSYREGFPKILIEAAASGKAAITTDVPGCNEAVIHNKTGIITKHKNSIELSKAIKKLVNDSDLRVRMGIQARDHAEKNFCITKVVNKHMSIYELL